jgi:hypothetical protein
MKIQIPMIRDLAAVINKSTAAGLDFLVSLHERDEYRKAYELACVAVVSLGRVFA